MFFRMLKAKRFEIALQANKLRNGLGKVEETTRLVGQMSEELAEAQVYYFAWKFLSLTHPSTQNIWVWGNRFEFFDIRFYFILLHRDIDVFNFWNFFGCEVFNSIYKLGQLFFLGFCCILLRHEV